MVGLNFSLGSGLMSLFGCLVILDTANLLESNLTWYTLNNLFHGQGYHISHSSQNDEFDVSLSLSLLHALFT
jgi:hypothetical protein